MSIKSRLLLLLLPTLLGFALIASLFFFFNWDKKITSSFKENLRSIVVTVSELIDPEEIVKLKEEKRNPSYSNLESYQSMVVTLQKLKKNLPVDALYIVEVEPVLVGEAVLKNQPVNENNPIYTGLDAAYAYRQIFLADSENQPLSEDFSETNEYLIYSTKNPVLSSIYQSKKTNEPLMTAYAPILSRDNNVIALVGADVNMELLNRTINQEVLWLALSTLGALLFITASVAFIANKIAKPVEQLKNAALSIAAGDYDEKINVSGPKEIADLANSFNTMSECLLDHNLRQKEQSFLREKYFGEQECALLLQNRMLDGVIEKFLDPRLQIRHVTGSSTGISQGLKLSLNSKKEQFIFQLLESDIEGFEGIYELLEGSRIAPNSLKINLNLTTRNLNIENHNMPDPLLWSLKLNRFVTDPITSYEKGDYLLITNQAIRSLFPNRQALRDYLSKVFRQFAKDHQDLLSVMLASEINFWLKKQNANDSIHLLLIREI